MLSKSKIFFKGTAAVLPHMLSVIPFGIITGAIGVELGFDPILVYATSLIIFGGRFTNNIYATIVRWSLIISSYYISWSN